MESKKQAKQNFFKKNIYYFIVAFMLLASIVVTIILFARGDNAIIDTANSTTSDNQAIVNSSIPDLHPDQSSTGKEPDLSDDPQPEQSAPTQKPMTFIIPVENATIICDYTASSVVFNKTLGIYTGHLAVDFAAEQGSEVKAVFDGKVESITTTYLTGTTITILHENNVKTVYNSVDAVEGLVEGQVVTQGQVIAYVSDNNKQEYKDGPHLHFEVYENGEKISPYKYLSVSDK